VLGVLNALARIGDPKSFDAVVRFIDELQSPLAILRKMYDIANRSELSVKYMTDQYIGMITEEATITRRCVDDVFIPLYRPILEEAAKVPNIDYERSIVPVSALTLAIQPLGRLLFRSLETLKAITKCGTTGAPDKHMEAKFEEIEHDVIESLLKLGATKSQAKTPAPGRL
jgi:hypothetical protein